MTIYKDPQTYAKEAYISLELATIRCAEYLPFVEAIEPAKKCPNCGEHTLAIELGSYEEGTSELVYCENEEGCDFTSEVTDELEPLQHWYAFDEVLALSCDIDRDGLSTFEEQLGCSWVEYAEKIIKKET